MQEELQKAEKLESLGTLAGGIAHDFNNALMAILGNISFVKSEVERGGDLFESLAEAENAVFRAKDLTAQLLTFSKGGSPIKKTGSLTGLIRDSVRYSLKKADVQSNFSIAEDLWPVEFDQAQIDQVIRNVATNAEQAMPDGGIVEVSAENVTLPGQSESGLPLFPGRYVKISIKDEGKGIPEDSISRIFDPFFTTKTKGSGLGLSVAYSIMNSHNGYIRALSQVGKGATFEIYLPAAGAVTGPEEAGPLPDVTFRGSVLIMDDEEGVLHAAGSLFKRLGMVVQTARDGVGAIELYQQAKLEGHPFDLVIMDLTIPGGMGGKEAIVKLLELDPSARAVVSSGYSNDPIMSDYSAYGFKGVLAKPYKIEQVIELLEKILPEAKY
jgi:CheY-like chemotaxis protein